MWLSDTRAWTRYLAFERLGGARCVCCGVAGSPFLCIDHIANDGAEWRRLHPHVDIYVEVAARRLWEGLQVLCYNCNLAKQMYGGTCPHRHPGSAPPATFKRPTNLLSPSP